MEFSDIEILKISKLKNEKLIVVFLFFLVISSMEWSVVHAVIKMQVSPLVALVFHTLMSLTCVGFVILFQLLKYDVRFPLLFAILLSALGPVGCLMMLFTFFLYVLESHFFKDSSIMEFLSPDFEHRRSTYIFNRITYGLESTEIKEKSSSYQEVMLFGTDQQKKMALEKIGRYFRPDFIPALKLALNDSNTTVRVHAGTTLSRLDTQFYNQTIKIENLLKDHPKDKSLLLAYAKHCEKYVRSNLLAPDLANKLRQKAIESYEKYLKVKPGDCQVLLSLAVLYMELSHTDESMEYLNQIFKTCPYIPANAYLIQLKILFKQNKYDEIREIAKKNISFDIEDPDLNELIDSLMVWKIN